MPSLFVARADLDPLSQSPVLFDALIAEDDAGATFQKTLTHDDPGVAAQRVTARWPHHLPGELIIALTGQAAVIATRRKGLIGEHWRGHGVRIREARFRAPVLLGETFYTRVEVGRTHKLGDNLHVSFRLRMWKRSDDGREIETFRSEQEAMFFPG